MRPTRILSGVELICSRRGTVATGKAFHVGNRRVKLLDKQGLLLHGLLLPFSVAFLWKVY